MGIPSFFDLHAAVTQADARSTLRCIAGAHGWRCSNGIDTDQSDSARDIFRRGIHPPDLKQVRDIIACLVCVEHQRGDYTHKNNIEKKWQDQLPSLDFRLRRSPSRYSLVSGKPAASRRGSSASATPTRKGRHASNATSIGEDVFLRTPERAPRCASEPVISATLGMSPEIVVHTADRPHDRAEPASPLQSPPGRTMPVGSADSMPGLAVEAALVSRPLTPPPPPNASLDETTGPPSRTKRRRVSSSAEGFSAGDCSTWAIWTLRTEVRALVLDPLPKPNDRGCIYVVQDIDTRKHVKIGMTMRPFRTRLAEIARGHQRSLDEANAWHLPGIPYIQLLRLEALVHADLAQYQRNLSVRNGGNKRTHREWFEVDVSTAQKTVRMWWDIMRNIGIKPGVELEPAVCEALNSSPAFDVDMAGEANADGGRSEADPQAEHTERMKTWTELLLSRPQSAGIWGSSSVARWILGCALLWILPETLGLSPKVAYLSQAAGVALWTRHVF
ncbi:hypothetical protein LTR85_008691 [Meristemomyces frigidus]|nr:hypothetical protein LTR85_008691 [Meristemomyces frigidus]